MNEWKYLKRKPKRQLKIQFSIKEVPISEYAKLAKFHYINTKTPNGKRRCFGMYFNGILYGIVIYASPSLELLARHKTPLGKILKKYGGRKNQSNQAKVLNRNTMAISRLVIHPSVRGIGLASTIIEETWRKLGVRFIEGFGVMAYYRNFHPKSFSYYIKVEKALKPSEFFEYSSAKGIMIKRMKSPVMRYGYVLYINENVKVKLL